MKNKSLILVLIILFLSSSASLFSQGFLKTSGWKIVDGQGNEFLLRGMGLGGWMLQEGYMLQTSGFADAQWQIKEKISALIGPQKTEEWYKLYRQNHTNSNDIDKLAEWGFNSIRLPMHYNLFNPSPGVYIEDGFAMIDSLLSWCERNRMYLILDLHAAPGGQSANNISDYNPSLPSLWESEENKTRTVELWKRIAQRYADKEWIGGYDLLNEPAWNLGSSNQPLRDLLIRITTEIRKVDTNHIIFAEGNWYATDFNGLTPPWDDNMAYSFHKYWNETNYGSISGYVNIRSTYNVPLWLGETGENSNAWFNETVELMEQQNIGWAWWPHKKIGSIAGPLSVIKNNEYDYLLKYWKGGAVKPTAEFAENALNKIAENFKLENCRFQPDVIDALFRQKNNTAAVPFTAHEIPGRIFAVDYDMGKHGYAYKDNNYKNTGSGEYNSGYQYRNDGVDIEACTDVLSNGFNVGWVGTGEFLTYTADVKTSGLYDVAFRVASNKAGGKIALRIDNIQAGLIDVPNTGGYQNWQTVTLPNIYLAAGSRQISVYFFFDGYNFNHLEFSLISTSAENPEAVVTEFELLQNYPNPFNPVTRIDYSVPSDGNVVIKLYNILGMEVAELFNSYQKAGIHQFTLNAAHLPSGIYFYELNAAGKSSVKKLTLMK